MNPNMNPSEIHDLKSPDMNLGKPEPGVPYQYEVAGGPSDPSTDASFANTDMDDPEIPDLTDLSDSEDDDDHFENDKKTSATTTAANKKQNTWSKPEKSDGCSNVDKSEENAEEINILSIQTKESTSKSATITPKIVGNKPKPA